MVGVAAMWRGGAVYAKRRNSCEADFGMNEFP